MPIPLHMKLPLGATRINSIFMLILKLERVLNDPCDFNLDLILTSKINSLEYYSRQPAARGTQHWQL